MLKSEVISNATVILACVFPHFENKIIYFYFSGVPSHLFISLHQKKSEMA